MTLATYADPDELYLARGAEVNPNRPLFTGDVLLDVAIPGVQDRGLGIVIAHPCSIRGAQGHLLDRILVAAVRSHQQVGRKSWTEGFHGRTPLPVLGDHGYCVGHLDQLGRAATTDALNTVRVACLSEVGINLLQQRLTFHLTRAEIPTSTFHQAFAHTLVEAELLEHWTDTLTDAGRSIAESAALFETFIRGGAPSLQEQLLEPELRASVRRACSREARNIVQQG